VFFCIKVIICYPNEVAVGCGAFKDFDCNTAEIKRMFVHPDYFEKELQGPLVQNWKFELMKTVT
jgi:putative acetyltransferase